VATGEQGSVGGSGGGHGAPGVEKEVSRPGQPVEMRAGGAPAAVAAQVVGPEGVHGDEQYRRCGGRNPVGTARGQEECEEHPAVTGNDQCPSSHRCLLKLSGHNSFTVVEKSTASPDFATEHRRSLCAWAP